MTNKLAKVFLLGLMSLCVPLLVWGQQDDRRVNAASSLYLISAKAGAVNFVSGDVTLERNDAKKTKLLKGDNVEVGEKISTQGDGKAEILLNPGSYVRIAGDSEFEFVTTSLDDLQLKINRGSAIFEVIADKDFSIKVFTPNSKFYLITVGVFRVDVTENSAGKIFVWKGKAQLDDAKGTIVKGGKTATVTNNLAAVEKFDRDNKNEFDNWSKDRAKEIAKINERLQRRAMSQALTNSFNNNIWSASTGYGLWVHDPFSRSFCFLPFGSRWRSPYGFGYNQSIWNYNPPPQVIAPMYQNPNLNNPNNPQPPMNPPSNNPTNPIGNAGNPTYQPPQSTPQPAPSYQRPEPIVERGDRPTRAQEPKID